FVIWTLTTQPDTLMALLVTPVWFLLLGIAWVILRRRPAHLVRYATFQAELAQDLEPDADKDLEELKR
ncbi:MAG TPA: D-serine/D-alanine/glycine transporter, partial [Arthrobacter sp.]|nr:D-serine/D-alanine/glycine transporter [Arthrobacter sp.]